MDTVLLVHGAYLQVRLVNKRLTPKDYR